jgi:hypothetical protein
MTGATAQTTAGDMMGAGREASAPERLRRTAESAPQTLESLKERERILSGKLDELAKRYEHLSILSSDAKINLKRATRRVKSLEKSLDRVRVKIKDHSGNEEQLIKKRAEAQQAVKIATEKEEFNLTLKRHQIEELEAINKRLTDQYRKAVEPITQFVENLDLTDKREQEKISLFGVHTESAERRTRKIDGQLDALKIERVVIRNVLSGPIDNPLLQISIDEDLRKVKVSLKRLNLESQAAAVALGKARAKVKDSIDVIASAKTAEAALQKTITHLRSRRAKLLDLVDSAKENRKRYLETAQITRKETRGAKKEKGGVETELSKVREEIALRTQKPPSVAPRTDDYMAHVRGHIGDVRTHMAWVDLNGIFGLRIYNEALGRGKALGKDLTLREDMSPENLDTLHWFMQQEIRRAKNPNDILVKQLDISQPLELRQAAEKIIWREYLTDTLETLAKWRSENLAPEEHIAAMERFARNEDIAELSEHTRFHIMLMAKLKKKEEKLTLSYIEEPIRSKRDTRASAISALESLMRNLNEGPIAAQAWTPTKPTYQVQIDWEELERERKRTEFRNMYN